ncbi:Zinc finger FYVE domain-containing protein 1 [Desmophyllum pertusum]|uniref:Zinc finger FYVE domain-containing protein 1 n=1 Tax=Desmophyllum pertusum TaxID=174260 RepID=A0A9W9YX81_9CNID|nr:Zinc finger FYVE domain-containing protein 1 [Desmophyllum pertusum]
MAATLPDGNDVDEAILLNHPTRKSSARKSKFKESKLPNTEESISTSPSSAAENMAGDQRCFLLLDEKENLQVHTVDDFIAKLSCHGETSMKVVSIFGNTGDGKSHTLNHTFFDGEELFATSSSQLSCTVGVWAAYDDVNRAIILDTEGLLGVSGNQNQRTRLLLKVLAISDIIVYRTRAERLHTDMFTFLGDASDAYLKHFTKELKDATERCHMDVPLCSLGPAVIIFHETQHTHLLGMSQNETNPSETANVKSPDEIIKERFADVGRVPHAFSSIKYLGTRTESPPTDFTELKQATRECLANSSVRSSRSPAIIYKALMLLNEKFSGGIERTIPNTFPDAYFTCQASCLSCNARCQKSMNHEKDESAEHQSEGRCHYQAQFDNRIFTCRACYERGKQTTVVPKMCSSGDSSWLGFAKYAWSGYVLECAECGIIYRSRQYWFGNDDPVNTVVRTELCHAWPGDNLAPLDGGNAARRLLDNVSYVTEAVSSLSSPSSRALTNWITDQVAPDYWIPNSEITACQDCRHLFVDGETKHHCRACGGGVCDACSTNKKPVPERGWGQAPVRVCDRCFGKSSTVEMQPQPACDLSDLSDALEEETPQEIVLTEEEDYSLYSDQPFGPVAARKVTEVVQSAVGILKIAIDYPRELITDAARPGYWVPDSDILACNCCEIEFTGNDTKHHCRACGMGVCSNCSESRTPVPSRGWDHPVRVCDQCAEKKGQL